MLRGTFRLPFATLAVVAGLLAAAGSAGAQGGGALPVSGFSWSENRNGSFGIVHPPACPRPPVLFTPPLGTDKGSRASRSDADGCEQVVALR